MHITPSSIVTCLALAIPAALALPHTGPQPLLDSQARLFQPAVPLTAPPAVPDYSSTFNFTQLAGDRLLLGRFSQSYVEFLALLDAAIAQFTLRPNGNVDTGAATPVYNKYFPTDQQSMNKVYYLFRGIRLESRKDPADSALSKVNFIYAGSVPFSVSGCEWKVMARTWSDRTTAEAASPNIYICPVTRTVWRMAGETTCDEYSRISEDMNIIGGLMLHEFLHWIAWTGTRAESPWQDNNLFPLGAPVIDQDYPAQFALDWGKAYGSARCAALRQDRPDDTLFNADSYAQFALEAWIKTVKCPNHGYLDADMADVPFICRFLASIAGVKLDPRSWCMGR